MGGGGGGMGKIDKLVSGGYNVDKGVNYYGRKECVSGQFLL